MSTGKLRVGLIGCGAMGSVHASTYLCLPNTTLVAIADVNEPWLRHCQDEWHVPHAFVDYQELLALPDVDAVSIVLPTFLHARVTMSALQAGKHVLVEKPMAMDAAEAGQMAQAAQRGGRVLMISHNQRFTPEAQYLKKYIEEGGLGDIYSVRTIWRRPLGMLPPPLLDRATGAYDRNWFNEASRGGGAVRDLGAHMIDLALWFMGFPALKDVIGCAYTKFGPEFVRGTAFSFDADDHGIGFARFQNGACLQVEASYGQHTDREVILTEIYGTQGGAVHAAGQPLRLCGMAAGAYATIEPRVPEIKVACTQAAFAGAVLDGTEPPVTPAQGVAVMRIIDGIYGRTQG